MMKKLIFILCILLIQNLVFAQNEHEILGNAVASFNKELPKLEKRAFKELKKLIDKNYYYRIKHSNYKLIIIPKYKTEEYIKHYNINDSISNYFDFHKIHNDFECFIFSDKVFQGSLHFSDCCNSCFLINDTNKFNKDAFIAHYDFAMQIINFSPDLVFSPESPDYIFFIKDNNLYIGKVNKQFHPVDDILPFYYYVKSNPSYIEYFQNNLYLSIFKTKHYIKLK